MNKTNKIAMLGIAVLFAVLAAIPAASAVPTLHFVPQDSSVPEGYCNTINVGIYLNLSAGDNVYYGQFGFSYDPLCGDITDRTMNAGWPPNYPIDPSWSSWNTTTYPECWNDTRDWIVFKFWEPHDGPEDILIGNITIHCNSTEYCINEMNFGWIPGCSQGPPKLWNGSHKEVPHSFINGTFECGTPPTFEKELVEGWNLISLPLTNTTNMTVANIIDKSLSGKYDALYRYDAVNKSWVAMGSCDVMENRVGYFIHMTAAGTWNYSGVPYESIDVNLEKGLNCVGWVNETGSALPDALNSIAGKYNYVARWNVTSQSYEVYEPHAPDVFNDFWTMDRGEGYWIAAKEDCTLSYTMP
ncbi:hypothetical protein CW713_01765 [Methanophagales archaeon]|nr:MAG: hypothetical protein CW713_01765 [Methanophagales archaeon]